MGYRHKIIWSPPSRIRDFSISQLYRWEKNKKTKQNLQYKVSLQLEQQTHNGITHSSVN